jgi:hypothetical protein
VLESFELTSKQEINEVYVIGSGSRKFAAPTFTQTPNCGYMIALIAIQTSGEVPSDSLTPSVISLNFKLENQTYANTQTTY